MRLTTVFSTRALAAFILFFTFTPLLVAGYNFDHYYVVDLYDEKNLVAYQYNPKGVTGIELCENNVDPDSLSQDTTVCDNLLNTQAMGSCGSVDPATCNPSTVSFNILSGRNGAICLRNKGELNCVSGTGATINYHDCGLCKCLKSDYDSGQNPIQCDKLIFADINYAFSDTRDFQKVFCGISTQPRASPSQTWSGNHVEYGCMVVNTTFYAVENDDNAKVDSTRDEGWDFYGRNASAVCDGVPATIGPNQPGFFGDRCWASTWWKPSAGFCAVPFVSGDPEKDDGYCFDGYCAFSIDNSSNVSENLWIWDTGSIGYTRLSDLDPAHPEYYLQHFCTGYMVTGLEVATFCADMGGSWETTSAFQDCTDGDSDADGWVDEYFRWTNENTCVECDTITHTKNNVTGATYLEAAAVKEPVCEVGCFASPGCDEVLPGTYNASGSYCDENCLSSMACPNNRVPEPGEYCYNPGVYNWGRCTLDCVGQTAQECGPNQCNGSASDAWCGINVQAGSECYCSALANLTLDIGNDNKPQWEWENSSVAFEQDRVWYLWQPPMEEVVVGKINNIISSGCGGPNCTGCILEGNDCVIPFVFRSSRPNASINEGNITAGMLTVEDINFTFWQLHTLDAVGYGRSFPSSDGSTWSFTYETVGGASQVSPYMRIPQDYSGSEQYFYVYGSPADGNDAMSNAMYRLLVEIDGSIEDGAVNLFDPIDNKYTPYDTQFGFNPDEMWFDGEDVARSMSLLGPVEVKLVVWM